MDIESETVRIQGFVEKANYHAAINIAISALNECRRKNDQSGVDHFLQVIKGIVEIMAEEFGTKEKTRQQ